MRISWQRMLWPWRRHLPTAAGLLMLLVALVLWLGVVRPLARENAQGQDRARAASALPAAAPIAPDAPSQRLKRYGEQLPRTDAAVEAVARIHGLGTAAGLSLPSGEYRMERRGDDPLVRYRVSLPVTGSYSQVRGFVVDVLREVPAAALDDIQLRRDPAGGKLEARVRFSLYLRAS